MFRVVLIHQLVLSLLVGPMLCCCSAAHLGRANGTSTRQAQSGEPARSGCCESKRHPPEQKPTVPGKSKPGEPSKCPCKDAPAKEIAAPVAPSGTADLPIVVASGYLNFELPPTIDGMKGDLRAPRFDHRSSSLSTSDILYAHHNLRC
jgi:hypothetical protein